MTPRQIEIRMYILDSPNLLEKIVKIFVNDLKAKTVIKFKEPSKDETFYISRSGVDVFYTPLSYFSIPIEMIFDNLKGDPIRVLPMNYPNLLSSIISANEMFEPCTIKGFYNDLTGVHHYNFIRNNKVGYIIHEDPFERIRLHKVTTEELFELLEKWKN